MSKTFHPPEQPNRAAQAASTSCRTFEWRPCPRHPWLGVSILSGRGFEPACYLGRHRSFSRSGRAGAGRMIDLDRAELYRLLTSREHLDFEGMPLTVVDGLFAIADSIDRLTDAVSTWVATEERAA